MNQGISYEISQVMPQATATGLFRSLAGFSAPAQAQGPTGNLQGTFAPVVGLQNIACMDAPESTMRVSSEETKTEAYIEAKRMRHVLLAGYYPLLKNAAAQGLQCSIADPNGSVTLYDLLGSESDSQATQTRCALQLVVV